MLKVSVNTGIQEVEVNDKGDTIKLRTADAAFQNQIVEFAAWTKNQQPRYEKLQEELENTNENDDLYEFLRVLNEINSIPGEAAAKVDGLFGAGACKKIFDTDTPDILSVLDFLEQIIPIFGDALKERTKERTAELKGKYKRVK